MRKMNKRVLEALIKAGAFDKIGPHRASIMESLASATHQAEQSLRDQTLGQHDLFGMVIQDSPVLKYVDVPEWSEANRLFGEKETLGLYLTGHPIHRFLKELKHFTTARLAEIRPQNNHTSTLAGIISGMRVILTKRGDKMAVVSLEDGSGQIDVLCFSETYNLYRELLVKDQLIIVDGEVSIDEFSGGFRVMCREVFSIEQARERHAKYLRISMPQYKAEEIEKLAGVLTKYRGGRCHVTIDYKSDDASANLRLGEAWRIKPTEKLFQDLRESSPETSLSVRFASNNGRNCGAVLFSEIG